MKKYTLTKIRNLLAKEGIDSTVLNKLDPAKKAIALKPKLVRRLEELVNNEGQVTIRRTNSGNMEIVSKKFVTIAPRRPMEFKTIRDKARATQNGAASLHPVA